jgi:hypothetical protein
MSEHDALLGAVLDAPDEDVPGPALVDEKSYLRTAKHPYPVRE